MKIITYILIFSAVFLSTLDTFAQSAWTQAKKSGFFKLEQRAIVAEQFFNLNGDIIPIITTGVYITSFYGELGVTDKITAFVFAPLFFRTTLNEQKFSLSNTSEPGDELNSIGDINVGASYQLLRKDRFVLAASLTLGIPSGEAAGGDTGLLQAGDGEFNQLIKIHGGNSLASAPIYLTYGMGFNNRTNDFSDEFHYFFEIGYTWKQLTAILKIYGTESFRNGHGAAAGSGIFSNNAQYFSYAPELVYSFNDKWGITASVGLAAAGKNILARPSYAIGIFLKK